MFNNHDVEAINTIRTLSIDAIEAANSGHPGLPMGAAPMAYVLWSRFLKINPATAKSGQIEIDSCFLLAMDQQCCIAYCI